MKTGVNTSTVINIRKKRNQWQRKGKDRCTSCEHFYYGYYCNKQKRSAEHYDKHKNCMFYVKKKKKKENKKK